MSDDRSRSGPAGGSSNNNTISENVTLRIVILAHGNRREDDLYLVLNLDTTLGELKNRIQESLPQRPSPSQQRIIYQGRGLETTDETLRTILRQDSRAGNSSYVLHLVIRQAPAGSQPTPSAPSTVSQQASNNTLPQARHPHVPQPSPHDAHMRIHNQIHQLQHSLQHQQAINRAQLAQALPHLPVPHLPMAPTVRPDQARIIRPENPFNLAAGQPQVMGPSNAASGFTSSQSPTSEPASGPSQTEPSVNQPTLAPAQAQMPHSHAMHAPHGPMAQSVTNTTQIRTAVNSDGQHTRTVINGGPTGTTTMTFRITGLNPPNPLDRPSSAPGASPSADAGPDNRTINPVPGNIQIHTQSHPVPMGFPFPPGLQLPFPAPNLAPLLNNPLQPWTAANTTAQPMAWLLSSPSGPQGIVFAPGHGFFNTAPVVGAAPAQLHPTPTQPQNVATPFAPLPQQAQLIVRPQPGDVVPIAQPRVHRRRARARPNVDQNEILQFIINRGWLFLRLYMFVFVFSESGTWRRIIMIGAIIIYCALPQQNPLTNALQVVRRHFDNLIGPPNLPQRPAQQTQQNEQNAEQPGAPRANGAQGEPSTSSRRGAAPMPTPEETARRLLEQQNRRNPNPVIDVLYRIEQGVVLFLASLVPGVGERHVRAREEARRIIQEEEQRRIADTSQQSQPTIEEGNARPSEGAEAHGDGQRSATEGGPLPDDWKTATQAHEESHGPQATSSGVDRGGRTENESVRSRTTNSGE